MRPFTFRRDGSQPECGQKLHSGAPCPQKGCKGGVLIRWGSYVRWVLKEGIVLAEVTVLRYCCKKCGKTVSQPPGHVVAYKRFDGGLIGHVLWLMYALGNSVYKLSKGILGPSLSTLRRWRSQFRMRAESVWQGLKDWGVAVGGSSGNQVQDVTRALDARFGDAGRSWMNEIQPVLVPEGIGLFLALC